MATSNPSRLLQLPPELRNRIYGFVFKDLTLHLKAQYKCEPEPQELYTTVPGILLTCKQTYEEAVGIYYSNATFEAPHVETIRYWASSLPALKKRGQHISKIRYDCAARTRFKQALPSSKMATYAQFMVDELCKELPGLENGTWLPNVVQFRVRLADESCV